MSYGTNAPWGLQATRLLSGATWSGQLNEYFVASGYNTNLFGGDPLYVTNAGTVAIATAGGGTPVMGVFNGIKYTTNNIVTFSPYWPANTVTQAAQNALAMVIDDPDMIYNIQCSTTVVVVGIQPGISQADLNNNADLVAGAGSTISGLSGWTLGYETIGNAATKQLKILRLVPVPGNKFSTHLIGGTFFPFNNVEVLLNNDAYKGGTGTAGV